jgi:tetratricopeptide (TPR) repeat protein
MHRYVVGRRVATAVLAVLLLTASGLFIVALWRMPQDVEDARPIVRDDGEELDAALTEVAGLIDHGEAAKALEVLQPLLVKHVDVQQVHLLHGQALTSLSRLDEAYRAYERALAIGPRDGQMEFEAGTLASATGRLQRAVEHYQAAQFAMKTDPRPPLFLAQVQLKLHRREEARASLAIAARLNPDLAVVWGTWAQLELDEGRPQIAAQHAARARELEPRVTLWRLLEARALRRQNKPEEALALLTGLDPAEQRNEHILNLMGECLGLLGRPGEAAALFAAAADSDPTNGKLSLDTALWYERAGEKHKALKYAEHAKMLAAPGAAEIVERLKP